MKAYKVYCLGGEGATIVFADTANRAKSIAKTCDCCEDAAWTDIRVRREPKADSLYVGKMEIDWCDQEQRTVLVRDLGWACLEPSRECDDCAARTWCEWHQNEEVTNA